MRYGLDSCDLGQGPVLGDCKHCNETRFRINGICGPYSSVGIATDYGLDGPEIESRWGEIFSRPDRPWGPPSLLYKGYRIFPGGKVRPGRATGHSPASSAAVIEE